MKQLFPWMLGSFVVIVAGSFTTFGKLVAMILALPFGIGGVEGFQAFWFIAALLGIPCFGFAATLLFPGKDGRMAGILSLTGLWIGLFSGAVAAMAIHRGMP